MHKPRQSLHTGLRNFSGSLRAWKGWTANARLAFLWHSKQHGICMDDVQMNRAIVRLPFQYGKYIVSIKTINNQPGQNSYPRP